MVSSAEGTRAVALELCREFEDKFLAHVTSGEVSDKLKYGLYIYLNQYVPNEIPDYKAVIQSKGVWLENCCKL